MRAYWALAQLHDQLHYWAYTKKYASIAMNIAQRIEEREAARELKLMLETLVWYFLFFRLLINDFERQWSIFFWYLVELFSHNGDSFVRLKQLFCCWVYSLLQFRYFIDFFVENGEFVGGYVGSCWQIFCLIFAEGELLKQDLMGLCKRVGV